LDFSSANWSSFFPSRFPSIFLRGPSHGGINP
jgi:hypothetical protein